MTLYSSSDFWFSKTPGFVPPEVSPQPRTNTTVALETLVRRCSFCGYVLIFLYKGHSHSHLNGQFFLEKESKISDPWEPKDHNQPALSRGVEDTINWPPFPPLPVLTELCLCKFTQAHSLWNSRKKWLLRYQNFPFFTRIVFQRYGTKYGLWNVRRYFSGASR